MQLFFTFCNIVAFNPVVMLRLNDTQKNFSECSHFCEIASAQNFAVMDGKFQITEVNAIKTEGTTEANIPASETEILVNDIAELSSQKAMISQAIMEGKLQIARLNDVMLEATAHANTVASEMELLTYDIAELSSQKAMIREEHAFERTRATADDEEYISAIEAAHRALLEDLQSRIDQSTKELSDKMAIKAQQEQAKAEAQASLLDVADFVAADTQYLADLTKKCSAKSSEY